MFVENTPIVTGVSKNSNYCSEFGPIIEEDGIISRQKVFGKTILTGKFYLTFLILIIFISVFFKPIYPKIKLAG
jgi:hypothetical protein